MLQNAQKTARKGFYDLDLFFNPKEEVVIGGPLPSKFLNFYPGTRVRISNATIQLLDGATLLVREGAWLELHSCSIVGQGHAWGLVKARGEMAVLKMVKCDVHSLGWDAAAKALTKTADPQYEDMLGDAVQVSMGATASLAYCRLQAVHGGGLFVLGSELNGDVNSSSATAHYCEAEGTQGAGFAAMDGATLQLEGCSTTRCVVGFLATGSRSLLQASPGCSDIASSSAGFWARDGGHLVAGDRCSTRQNDHAGFRASGEQARMEAGMGCSAEGIGGPGFHADDSAVLMVGKGSVVRNSEVGFQAGSKRNITAPDPANIVVGPDCRSENNGLGFLADNGSRLIAGDDCLAFNSRGSGFIASGYSTLQAGSNCKALRSRRHGFYATTMQGSAADDTFGPAGSRMLLGKGAAAVCNMGCGFLAEGSTTQLQMEGSCSAEGNREYGISIKGGAVVAVLGTCTALGNGQAAYHIIDGDGVLQMDGLDQGSRGADAGDDKDKE
jgi:hypothetical protein